MKVVRHDDEFMQTKTLFLAIVSKNIQVAPPCDRIAAERAVQMWRM